jgi:hypothetical protein
MQKIERMSLEQSSHALAGGAEKVSVNGNTQIGNNTFGDINVSQRGDTNVDVKIKPDGSTMVA